MRPFIVGWRLPSHLTKENSWATPASLTGTHNTVLDHPITLQRHLGDICHQLDTLAPLPALLTGTDHSTVHNDVGSQPFLLTLPLQPSNSSLPLCTPPACIDCITALLKGGLRPCKSAGQADGIMNAGANHSHRSGPIQLLSGQDDSPVCTSSSWQHGAA